MKQLAGIGTHIVYPAKILAALCFRGAGGVMGTLIARLSVSTVLNGVMGVTIARRGWHLAIRCSHGYGCESLMSEQDLRMAA